jgi:hypothetical protein
MTNDELLQKLHAHLQLNLDTLIQDLEEQETEYGEDRDEFDSGYVAGLKFAITRIEFIQDGTTELK